MAFISPLEEMIYSHPCAAVAQLDRVLGYEPRGRGFESCQPRHFQCIQPVKDLTGCFV